MDHTELQSCLHSLKQLYRLLLSNSVSVMLDDKSRLLLKDLLDNATENVFNSYSKKGNSSMEFTGSPSNSEESDSTYHDCITIGSDSADDSLNKLAYVRRRSHLSTQASDAIRKTDKLSDRRNGIVLQPESARLVVVQKPSRNKPSKTDHRYPYEQRYHARDSDQMNRKARKLQPSLPRNAGRKYQRQHESVASLSSTSSKWRSQKTSIPYEPQQWIPTSSLSGDCIQDYSVSCSDDNVVYSWVSGEEPYASTSGSYYSGDEPSGSHYSGDESSGSYYSGDDETEGYFKPRFQRSRQPRDRSVRSTSNKKMRQRREKCHVETKLLSCGTEYGQTKKQSKMMESHKRRQSSRELA